MVALKTCATALAGAVLLGASTATAATFYDAEASLTLRLVRIGGTASVSVETQVDGLGANAVGDFGTSASANNTGTSDRDGPLAAGDSLTLVSNATGQTAATVTGPNLSSALYDWFGELTIQGGSAGGTAEIEGVYSLSALATLDNPALETAYGLARIGLDLGFGGTTIVVDTLGGGGPLTDVPFGFTVSLQAGVSTTITIDVFARGEATALPAPVPLPAAAPLLLAGLATLGFVARRRGA